MVNTVQDGEETEIPASQQRVVSGGASGAKSNMQVHLSPL